MDLLTQKMNSDSDIDEEKSDLLSEDEILTQTQKMETDSDDEEKSDLLSEQELMTTTETQQILIDSDHNISKIKKKVNGLCDNLSNATSLCHSHVNNGAIAKKRDNEEIKVNLLYLEQSSSQNRNSKFYPPEIVKRNHKKYELKFKTVIIKKKYNTL